MCPVTGVKQPICDVDVIKYIQVAKSKYIQIHSSDKKDVSPLFGFRVQVNTFAYYMQLISNQECGKNSNYILNSQSVKHNVIKFL